MSTPQDKVFALHFAPGIQRDGTGFSSQYWTDGQWVRFWADGSGVPKPRKMGGYAQLTTIDNIARGSYVQPNPPNFNVYIGDQDELFYIPIDQFGTALGPEVGRTPALYIPNVNNDWQFDTMYSTINNSSILVAFAAPNLASVASNVDAAVYYGDSLANTPLIPTGFNVSGGIVVLSPFLVMYGNDGNIIVSNPNDPTTEFFTARVTNSKIVFGLPVRAGNSSPAGLFWSLDSLIRMTFVGGTEIFNFDTVTAESSILSSRGIIEYDNEYFWAGIDRFLFYNGVVQELPNDKSLDFFFANVNYAQRQKVWATKVTSAGEIWWFFPTGNNVECNHAVIYNRRLKCWYDTAINRSDGYFDQTFASPIWTDNVASGGEYPVWIHETGVDQNVGNVLTAIDSFIQSGDIAYCANGPGGQRIGLDRWVYLTRVEPDFLQDENLTLTVTGRDYAISNPAVSTQNPYVITPTTVKVDMREQAREMRLKFESNAIGGDYFMGQVLLVARIGDGRQSGTSP